MPLQTTFAVSEAQAYANLPKLMPAEDRTLMMRFKLCMGEVAGDMTLVFPGLMWSSVLRRLAEESLYAGAGPGSGGSKMRELLLDARFTFDLGFDDVMLPAADLLQLSNGQVLRLRRTIQQPATASVGELPLFR